MTVLGTVPVYALHEHRGQVAFQAYWEAMHGEVADYDPEFWHRLGEVTREAWRRSAMAVTRPFVDELERVQQTKGTLPAVG